MCPPLAAVQHNMYTVVKGKISFIDHFTEVFAD